MSKCRLWRGYKKKCKCEECRSRSNGSSNKGLNIRKGALPWSGHGCSLVYKKYTKLILRVEPALWVFHLTSGATVQCPNIQYNRPRDDGSCPHILHKILMQQLGARTTQSRVSRTNISPSKFFFYFWMITFTKQKLLQYKRKRSYIFSCPMPAK